MIESVAIYREKKKTARNAERIPILEHLFDHNRCVHIHVWRDCYIQCSVSLHLTKIIL